MGRGLVRGLIACLALLCAGPALADECRADLVHLRGDFGQARFVVDVADTQRSRNRGLMHRRSMSFGAGMLFVYDRPQPVAFWMENTLIALDMIFMDARGVVQKVHANAIPGDRTAIPGGDAIQYVLEINGGLAARMGIGPGAELRHPAIDPALAAWSCSDAG